MGHAIQWTGPQDASLAVWVANGESMIEMAFRLDFSISAVRRRCQKLGLVRPAQARQRSGNKTKRRQDLRIVKPTGGPVHERSPHPVLGELGPVEQAAIVLGRRVCEVAGGWSLDGQSVTSRDLVTAANEIGYTIAYPCVRAHSRALGSGPGLQV